MLKWLLVIAAAVPLFAADPKADVLAAIEAWKTAMIKKDTAALDLLLHPDLTYTHSNTHTQTKADVLADKSDNRDIVIGETSVRIFGDTAIVKAPMDFVMGSATGTSTSRLVVLQVWIKGAGGWQMVARQATKLPAQ